MPQDSNEAICLRCSPFLTSQDFSKCLPLPPGSESPGLLFNLQTHRLRPNPPNQNLQDQAQQPVSFTSSSRRFFQTEILFPLPLR